MQYNGLDSDLKTLAKFLYIYEVWIKKMNRADDFLNLSKDAAHIFKSELQPQIKYATKDEIANRTDFAKTKTLFFTKHKVQIIDFCRHLRNSFGHALLVKQATRINSLSIRDNSHGKTTCIGFLNYNLVRKFIICVCCDYEQITDK